jgi:hypothetical protein
VLQPVPAGHPFAVLPRYMLVARFHFTVRTGVTVQVTPESGDAVRVHIVMNSVSYKLAQLPPKKDRRVKFGDLISLEPEAAASINDFLEYDKPTHLWKLGVADDVLTDAYDAPVAASGRDDEIVSAPVNALGERQHFSVDDNQPFPIYGWLALYWQESQAPLHP